MLIFFFNNISFQEFALEVYRVTSFSFALAAAARTMIMFITVFEQKGPGVD